MCVHVTKTANRFEISSLLEKILLKQVRWCLTFVGLYILPLRINTISFVCHSSLPYYTYYVQYHTGEKSGNHHSQCQQPTRYHRKEIHRHVHVLPTPVVLGYGYNDIIIIIYITVPVTGVRIAPSSDNNVADIIGEEQTLAYTTGNSCAVVWIKCYNYYYLY